MSYLEHYPSVTTTSTFVIHVFPPCGVLDWHGRYTYWLEEQDRKVTLNVGGADHEIQPLNVMFTEYLLAQILKLYDPSVLVCGNRVF